jgi:hypothetical protein
MIPSVDLWIWGADLHPRRHDIRLISMIFFFIVQTVYPDMANLLGGAQLYSSGVLFPKLTEIPSVGHDSRRLVTLEHKCGYTTSIHTSTPIQALQYVYIRAL